MFGSVKKEEVSSMTQPLLVSQPGEAGIHYPDDNSDLIDEIISSIAATTAPTNAPEYVQNASTLNGMLQNDNYVNVSAYVGPGSINGSGAVYGYGQTYGNDNPVFMDESYSAGCGNNPGFDIDYLQFPEQVLKVQRRQGRESHQRLRSTDAQVKLGIMLHRPAQVTSIRVYVSRVYDPSFQLTDIWKDPVLLEVKPMKVSDEEYQVNANLDSIYEISGKKVYALAKNKTEEVNLFYLKVVLTFLDGSTSEANTKNFRIVGKAKDSVQKGKTDTALPEASPSYLPSPMVAASKRQRTDTDESNSTSVSASSSGYYPSPGAYGCASPQEEGLVKASRIAADYLEAQNAEIGSLMVAEPVKTKHGDIAYHFILKNPDDHPEFDEGEIVGLFVNESGTRVLDKLSQKNSLDAILKGVITRSYYLEAHVQPKGVRTETICMFGIVPVRVKGQVNRGDILYASPDSPGVAVSSNSLNAMPSLCNDAAAIGMAWGAVSAHDDELNHIQCLVSITMEIFQGMIEKRMKSLKKNVDSDIAGIKLARKKSTKRKYICITTLAIFIVLVSILLWQLFMPMSAFRKWMCGIGHISGHSGSFSFVPTSHQSDWYDARGKEFTFDRLEKKVDTTLPKINVTGFRFYYNVERCANFGKTDSDTVLKTTSVGGPMVFALDPSCKHAYYYGTVKNKWCKYRSARNVKCIPPPSIKSPSSTNATSTGPGYC